MGKKVSPENVFPLLTGLETVYRTGRSPRELALLAQFFAGALDGEELQDVRRAFAEHIRRSRFFPVPAEIVSLMPQCRQREPLPPRPEGKITEGYGPLMARKILAKLRGRPEPEAEAGTAAFEAWEEWSSRQADGAEPGMGGGCGRRPGPGRR